VLIRNLRGMNTVWQVLQTSRLQPCEHNQGFKCLTSSSSRSKLGAR
jgi:hypothetical protein